MDSHDVSGLWLFAGRVLVDDPPITLQNDTLIGVTVGTVGEGEVVTKQIQLVVDGDGNEVPSRTD